MFPLKKTIRRKLVLCVSRISWPAKGSKALCFAVLPLDHLFGHFTYRSWQTILGKVLQQFLCQMRQQIGQLVFQKWGNYVLEIAFVGSINSSFVSWVMVFTIMFLLKGSYIWIVLASYQQQIQLHMIVAAISLWYIWQKISNCGFSISSGCIGSINGSTEFAS